MVQLEYWFRSWVPDSVHSAGIGCSSVEAWFTNAQDIEEVLSGAVDSDLHLFVAGVIESFDTVDRGVWKGSRAVWACLIGSVMSILSSCACQAAV